MTEHEVSPDDAAADVPNCPKCTGPMWDNREGKRNPKAPDFKCKDRECDGVIWPKRDASQAQPAAAEGVMPGKGNKGNNAEGMPLCPICGGAMWDDRLSKRNPKAPDFKCRNKPKERGGPGCEGVIWPSRDGSPSPYPAPVPRAPRTEQSSPPPYDGAPPHNEPPPFDDDDLPF